MRRGRHTKPRKPVLLTVMFSFLILLGLLLFAGKFGLVGHRAFIVQSGSMGPAIEQNSVVLTAPATSPSVGDVITYELPDQPDILVTHRIVDVEQQGGETGYITKGDANDDADGDLVPHDSVVGQVKVAIPWIGVVVNWARSDIGFILMIIIPATVIVYGEILSLKQQILERRFSRPSPDSARFAASVTSSGGTTKRDSGS